MIMPWRTITRVWKRCNFLKFDLDVSREWITVVQSRTNDAASDGSDNVDNQRLTTTQSFDICSLVLAEQQIHIRCNDTGYFGRLFYRGVVDFEATCSNISILFNSVAISQMSYSFQQPVDVIHVSNAAINSLSTIKSLGVTRDRKLSFDVTNTMCRLC